MASLKNLLSAMIDEINEAPRSVNGVTPDENGDIKIKVGTGTGGVSSWNDLTDKPFYEEVTKTNVLEWDGDITGKVAIELEEGVTIVQVSNEPVPAESLIGATITFSIGATITVTEDMIQPVAEGTYSIAEFAVVVASDVDIMGITVPKGIGFVTSQGIHASKIEATEPIFVESEIKKLDNKFLDVEWLPTQTEKLIEIVPETSIDTSSTGLLSFENPVEITVGYKYVVNFDGQDYTCVAKELFTNTFYIGNLACWSEDNPNTGEPFMLGGKLEAITGMSIDTLEDGVHTFRIVEKTPIYNKLPKEFLPSSDYTDYTVSTDLNTKLTAEQVQIIVKTLQNGKKVYATLDGIKGEIINLKQFDAFDNLYTLCFISSANMQRVIAFVEVNLLTGTAPLIRGLYNDQIILTKEDPNSKAERYAIEIDTTGEAPILALSKMLEGEWVKQPKLATTDYVDQVNGGAGVFYVDYILGTDMASATTEVPFAVIKEKMEQEIPVIARVYTGATTYVYGLVNAFADTAVMFTVITTSGNRPAIAIVTTMADDTTTASYSILATE